ncbi:phosphate ABC transporter substrate-binding protein [Pelomonas sp. SE-A7]|uniref:phosphate ABC transporter substrate-binding protein n=1 Tax=Pelomonas sp. SE-A7 TaxID=3054953 RepID=UPI00259CBEC3|nr:phosphate ABC transporter substrate-binding protein [Pelomonas sp. SE-A7]MDM4765146.1 phosphate ABC transporter substrate-binding protein [Pelomonas sp. SE-A7]
MGHRLRLPIRLAWLLVVGLAWPLIAGADLVVIVHPDNPLKALQPRQVSDLYLGRTRQFAGADVTAQPALVYEQPSGSVVRQRFFSALNGMEIKQVNAYWARLRFSGEVLPPPILADSLAVREAVSQDRMAIGYIDAALLNASVKPVLRLKD